MTVGINGYRYHYIMDRNERDVCFAKKSSAVDSLVDIICIGKSYLHLKATFGVYSLTKILKKKS